MSSTGTKTQLEKPGVATPEVPQVEDHLFEQEAQLEQSGVSFRLIAIIAVIVAIGVGIGYFFVHQQRDLTAADATPVLNSLLRARGPALISFKTGHGAEHCGKATRPALPSSAEGRHHRHK
jgi:hypothetical protein